MTGLARVQPRRLEASLEAGSSRPLRVADAAGRSWFLRCAGAAEFGADVLGELLAWQLALALGDALQVRLCTPVWADLDALQRPPRLDAELADSLDRGAGLGFGRAWLDGAAAADPRRAGPGLFLLDLILLNPDRRRREPHLIENAAGLWAIDFGAAWLARCVAAPALQSDHHLWHCLRDHAAVPDSSAQIAALLATLDIDPARIVAAIRTAAEAHIDVPEALQDALTQRLDPQRLGAETALILALPEPDPAAERAARQRRKTAAEARHPWMRPQR